MKKIIYLFITILVYTLYKPSYAIWNSSSINKINLITNWNTNYVNPFVITNPINKMWFSGHIGWWVIGTADYINNNWIGNNTIAINHDNLVKEIISSNIIYDQDSKLYRMWFIGLVNSNWQSGIDRFRLFYSYSLDSIIWSSPPILALKGEDSCIYEDCGGINRGISIIKSNNKYHLWYTATNANDMGSDPFWRIGYATSDDGITWTKQNNKLPVITPTESFDLKNQSFPNVILENNKFLMWYGAGSTDMPTQYNFAESDDGIHWYKPPEINPVLTIQPNTFYSGSLAGNQTLEEGDTYHIYFSGHNGSVWSIGEAYVPKSDYAPYITPAPTPFPTPEETITPEPSSTPIPPTNTPILPTETPIPPTITPVPEFTPIPTNTIRPSRPPTVIIIPGITASWNTNALMQCQPGDNGGTWTYLPIVAKNLYSVSEKALETAGFTVLHFTYDWRIPVTQNADKLAQFINEKAHNEDIYLLGHSMGGLIARAYGEKYHTNSPVKKILTVGAPFEGSVNAYYTWSGGEFLGDLVSKFYATLLLSRCTQFKLKTGADAIHTFIPSISDLLPTFPYLINSQTGTLIPISTMQAKNTLQKDASYQNPYHSITTGSLIGSGQQTAETITVTVPKKKTSIWADGQPISTNPIGYSQEGDGTVLAKSAYIHGNTLSDLSLSHSELMTDPVSIHAIISFFQGAIPQNKSMSQLSFKVSNSQKKSTAPLLSFVGYPMKFIVIPPHGSPEIDTNGIVEIENPEEGNYKIIVQPTDKDSTLSIGSMNQSGDISWKSHDFHTIFPKIMHFHLKK